MSSFYDESLEPFIRDILPELQESLKKDMLGQLQAQFEEEMKKQIERIEAQAMEEYQQAIADLEQEGPKIEKQGMQSLQKQFEKLTKQKEAKQNNHLRTLQDRYISQNFQQLILGHPKIKSLQLELENEIRQQNQQKILATKQRKLKQLLIKLQNRQQKQRIHRDQVIKKQMYASNGIQDLKKDIQTLRIGIAAMKSEYNIKIKKIQTQIKQIKAKNKLIQPKQDVNKLREQLQKMQEERDRINQKILAEEEQKVNQKHGISAQQGSFYNNPNEQFSRNYSHLDSSSQHSILRNPTCDIRYYNNDQDIVIQSQGQNYSSEQSSYGQPDDNIMYPPRYHPSFDQNSQNDDNSHLPGKQDDDHQYQPILNFNISKLLRSNWQTDPLQKYLNDETMEEDDKQNMGFLGNKGSNFQQMYRQHLEKLNKGSQKRKLSFNAKKTIIRNLGLLGRNKSGMLSN